MKIEARTVLKAAGAAVVVLLAAGIAAPYVNADRYGERLRGSLERALGRQVEFQGKVQFSVFGGGFTVESPGVVIHEDPSIGLEPIAYVDSMTVRPAVWALLGGRFVIASIKLDGAQINLTKSGPAQDWGRWNFASFVNRSVMSSAPEIQVRNGRINFKFGDEKSVFYLTEADLDIDPPVAAGRGWRLDCSAKPARTDRTEQGLGAFRLRGRWYVAPERVDLNLELDRTGLDEITALFRGQAGGVHGTISSRLHLAGPINQVGMVGRLNIDDVHRWDLLPGHGQSWPLDVRGRLDLVAQQLEIESSSVDNAALPLSVHFRAGDYLSQPHWAVSLNWNRFPVGPLMEMAVHMGAQFPRGLQLAGALDGAIGYSGRGSLQGTLEFHDGAVTIPDSPPIRFERADVVLDHGQAHLTPALVHTGDDEARIEAGYAMDRDVLELAISTDNMKVASLRAQVALAAVPWLEQIKAGEWSGTLHYHHEAARAGWTGNLQVSQAQILLPELADPLELAAAHAVIDGKRVAIDHMRGKAGKLAFTGEYRYEPAAARPHRVRLRAEEWDAADVEAEWLPTLRRPRSLIARALGRASLPEWMARSSVDATVQIDSLAVAGATFEDLRAHLIWDGPRVQFDSLQARLEGATVSGKLAVNLMGQRPAYKLGTKVKGLEWQSGRLDGEGTVEAAGTGKQLLASLKSEGTFAGTALDFGLPGPCRTASGSFTLDWQQGAPRFRLTSLNLRTEDNTYTGRGATQDDGRMLIVLSDGAREMRVSGALGKLKMDQTVRP